MNLQQVDLEASVIAPIALFRADLPGFTARFWTGVGPLTALSQTWEGSGEVIQVAAVEGTLNASSPRLVISLTSLDTNLVGELKDYLARGSAAYLYFALINQDTGALMATPDLVASGFIDTVTIAAGEKAGAEADVVGALEYLKRNGVRRSTPSDQESIWSDDRYFEFVGDDRSLPWGNTNASAPSRSGGGGGSGVGASGADPSRQAL